MTVYDIGTPSVFGWNVQGPGLAVAQREGRKHGLGLLAGPYDRIPQAVDRSGHPRGPDPADAYLRQLYAGINNKTVRLWLFSTLKQPAIVFTLNEAGKDSYRSLEFEDQLLVRRILSLHRSVYPEEAIDMIILAEHEDKGMLVSMPKDSARRFDAFRVESSMLVYRDYLMPAEGTIEEALGKVQRKTSCRIIGDDIFD